MTSWAQFRGRPAEAILEHFRVVHAPVNVFAILRQLDLVVQEVPNPGWDGALSWHEKQPYIWLDTADSQPRKRLTAAYLLGHVLNQTQPCTITVVRCNDSTAMEFALRLLIPLSIGRPLAMLHHYDAIRLANVFQAPYDAMVARLGKL